MAARLRRMFLGFTAAAVLVYGGACGLLYLAQSSLVFLPSREVGPTPADAGVSFREFEIKTGPDSSVHGWLHQVGPAAPWIIHFHGNAGNICGRIDQLKMFSQLGLNGVVFDYRGYGRSQGHPSESGLVEDGVAVIDFLTQQEGLTLDRAVFFGESLGGGVATAVAEQRTPAGLILKSTFTSIPDRASELYPWLPVRHLSRVRFPNLERVRTLSCPKLFIHGDPDEVVPFHHGRRLFQAACQPKEWLQVPGGHSRGPFQLGPEFPQRLGAFCLSVTDYPDRKNL